MKFYAKIHKKPRGNWRPQLDIEISISAEDYPHRPRLKGLMLVFPCSRCSEKRCFNIPSDKADVIVLTDEIWDNPKHGKGFVPSYVCKNGWGYQYIRIFDPCWLDTDLTFKYTGYLQWRPGPCPDYLDYAEALSKIPLMLEEQLKDGLDSGESEEIVLTRESVILKAVSDQIGSKRKILVKEEEKNSVITEIEGRK